MAVVTMRQLLDSGVHFGHQTSRWNPKMKRFIFTERNGIYIIDLQQSLTKIDAAYEFVRDTVALGDQDGTGWVEGHGPVPGDLIRQWVADNLDPDALENTTAWLRRVYETPTTGALVAMESKATRFTGNLAAFLRLRDRTCRTPGCGARIRHHDHIDPLARGGPTTADNGQGLCERCNYAKQAHGWEANVIPGPRHTVEITTPTGHRHHSRPPDPPGAPDPTTRLLQHLVA